MTLKTMSINNLVPGNVYALNFMGYLKKVIVTNDRDEEYILRVETGDKETPIYELIDKEIKCFYPKKTIYCEKFSNLGELYKEEHSFEDYIVTGTLNIMVEHSDAEFVVKNVKVVFDGEYIEGSSGKF